MQSFFRQDSMKFRWLLIRFRYSQDPSEPIKIAGQLDILPQDFLYLGDTSIDMQTAVAAGMYATGVLWGFRPAEELIDAGARILVRTPADLLAWI